MSSYKWKQFLETACFAVSRYLSIKLRKKCKKKKRKGHFGLNCLCFIGSVKIVYVFWLNMSIFWSVSDRGWDGWTASLARWMWVWVNSGSWWWTGRPGVLRFMGLQSRTWLSDWTELNWKIEIDSVWFLPTLLKLWYVGQQKWRIRL